MNQNIEYAKFETFGLWQENSETPELKVVVSFGKSSLVIRDVNDSILTQWSFPSISTKMLSGGQIIFFPDEDGFETLRITDEEMIEQLKKVAQKPITSGKNFRPVFFLTVTILLILCSGLYSKNILVKIATSITPTGKASIVFENLMGAKNNNIGLKCTNIKGQRILDRIVGQYEYIEGITVIKSDKNEFFSLPGRQIIISDNFIGHIKDPIEISEFLSFADKANQSNIPLKLFFSKQSFFDLSKYISGLSVEWDPKVFEELTIANIKYFVEVKLSRKKTQISGLEWVAIQNFCERL